MTVVKLHYSFQIADPLHNRPVTDPSKRWRSLGACRIEGVSVAREIIAERGWPVVWVIIRNRDGRVLRHLSVFRDTVRVARNRNMEDR